MIEDSDIGPPPGTTDSGAGTTDAVPPYPTGVSTPPTSVAGAPAAGTPAGTMTITFKLYATLQDLLPHGAMKNAVAIEVAVDTSLNDVIDRYKIPRELAHLVLVNGVFVCHADRDARGALVPGDVLAIWPPVAGG